MRFFILFILATGAELFAAEVVKQEIVPIGGYLYASVHFREGNHQWSIKEAIGLSSQGLATVRSTSAPLNEALRAQLTLLYLTWFQDWRAGRKQAPPAAVLNFLTRSGAIEQNEIAERTYIPFVAGNHAGEKQSGRPIEQFGRPFRLCQEFPLGTFFELSSDGKKITVGSNVYDLRSGAQKNEKATKDGHELYKAAKSRKDAGFMRRSLAAGRFFEIKGNSLRIVDSKTNRILHQIELPSSSSESGSATSSPDGRFISVSLDGTNGFDGTTFLFNAANGQLLRKLPHFLYGSSSFSPDGRFMMYESGAWHNHFIQVNFLDLKTLRVTQRIEIPHSHRNQMEFSSDGNLFALSVTDTNRQTHSPMETGRTQVYARDGQCP